MGKAKNSTRQKKNTQRKANTPKAATAPTHNFDYYQLREAIVEANRIIREEEKTANHKAFEEDYMTKLLIELLNVLFISAMAILGILSIASVVLSFKDSFASGNSMDKIICVICWLVFIVGIFALLLVMRLKKQGKFSKRFWLNFVAYVISALYVGTFIVACFSSQLLCLTMSFTVVLVILFSFCYLAMQSLKRESDRAYLVSYFSAITGIVALVVSAITLVVTLLHNS